jgi:hypothetical protein
MPAPITPPLAQFQPNAQPYGNLTTGPGGVALTGVNPQELTSYQLGQLQRSDNPLVQTAQNNARNFAAARGAGLSGSNYAQAATGAAFDAMTPIATADAGQYADVRDRNQTAMNQQNIERMGNETSLGVANIGAGASMYNSDNAREEARYEFNRGQENRLQNRQWQVADQNTAARASQRSQLFSQATQAIFSDPAYWRDPQAAMGLLNEYGSNMDNLMQQLFPEYFSTDQNGNPVAPPAGQAPPPSNVYTPPSHGTR